MVPQFLVENSDHFFLRRKRKALKFERGFIDGRQASAIIPRNLEAQSQHPGSPNALVAPVCCWRNLRVQPRTDFWCSSLSFVSPLDRKVSARSRHSSEPQRTVAEGGDRTFKNRPEKDQSPPASRHSVASAEYVSPANADILGYAEL